MKNSQAVIQSRQNDILKILQKQDHVQVTVLAERLGVTQATVRRDLKQMEEAGKVVRGFGTAKYFEPRDMKEIEPTNIEDEKEIIRRRIAKRAAEMVEDGDVIFMNSSGTASLVLEYLTNKRVAILTNNARIIKRDHPSNLQILLTGGELYGKKQSLIGQFAQDTIAKVAANKCILGVSGISASGGLTSVILPDTQINMQMIQQCRGPRIVLADGSKVGLTQNYYSGDIRDITYMITDTSTNTKAVQEIESMGVQVVIV